MQIIHSAFTLGNGQYLQTCFWQTNIWTVKPFANKNIPSATLFVYKCTIVVCCPLPSQQHFKHVFLSQTAAFQSHKGFRGQVKTRCKHLMGQASPGLRRIRAVQVIQVQFYIYIYIPRAPLNSIFVGQPPRKQSPFQPKQGSFGFQVYMVDSSLGYTPSTCLVFITHKRQIMWRWFESDEPTKLFGSKVIIFSWKKQWTFGPLSNFEIMGKGPFWGHDS